LACRHLDIFTIVSFSLHIRTYCLYVVWEKQWPMWAKIICLPKYMHSASAYEQQCNMNTSQERRVEKRSFTSSRFFLWLILQIKYFLVVIVRRIVQVASSVVKICCDVRKLMKTTVNQHVNHTTTNIKHTERTKD